MLHTRGKTEREHDSVMLITIIPNRTLMSMTSLLSPLLNTRSTKPTSCSTVFTTPPPCPRAETRSRSSSSCATSGRRSRRASTAAAPCAPSSPGRSTTAARQWPSRPWTSCVRSSTPPVSRRRAHKSADQTLGAAITMPESLWTVEGSLATVGLHKHVASEQE